MRKFVAALAVLVALAGPAFAQPSIPPDVTAQLGSDLAQAQHDIAQAQAPTGPSADILIQSVLLQTVKGKTVVAKAIGSGVYVGRGQFLTDLHVVDGAKAIKITLDRAGVAAEKFKATVVATDKENDLALLAVKGDLPAGMQEAQLACRAPVIGEPIEVVGNPLGITFVHTWGRVAGVARSDDHQAGIAETLAPMDVMIASGNSGGPVYDKDGKVLGLADAALSVDGSGDGVGHVNFMTPSIVFPPCKQAASK